MKPYAVQDKKSEIRSMFDGISGEYDRINSLISVGLDRRWRRHVVSEVERVAPCRVLDVATGTGDIAISLCSKLPSAEVIGVDLSASMIKQAKAKAAARGARVNFMQADGEQLPFADGSVDCCVTAFGIRNFSDIAAGLNEQFRVLESGGSAFVLEFSVPRGNFFAPLFRLWFHGVVPFIGGTLSRDRSAYAYLPASVDGFPPSEQFLGMMYRAGFVSCAAHKLTGGVAYLYRGVKP